MNETVIKRNRKLDAGAFQGGIHGGDKSLMREVMALREENKKLCKELDQTKSISVGLNNSLNEAKDVVDELKDSIDKLNGDYREKLGAMFKGMTITSEYIIEALEYLDRELGQHGNAIVLFSRIWDRMDDDLSSSAGAELRVDPKYKDEASMFLRRFSTDVKYMFFAEMTRRERAEVKKTLGYPTMVFGDKLDD